jgi:2-succinyl-5-enolpyruvyl-6-hydroxy-3-cyclohexene-1-carboxylate synthase
VLDCQRLTHQLVIDERSAAFIALGRAKLDGLPTLLLCTSGSAVAHYFPAVIEADEGAIPLLMLSADRPPEAQANRSAQTIDQLHLFGRKVRGFFDVGMADPSYGALLGLRRKALQAFELSRFPAAGPVHINFPARKPLEPDRKRLRSADSDEARLERQVSEVLTVPATERCAVLSIPAQSALDRLVQSASQAKRPALLLGPTDPWRAPDSEVLAEFASRSGWPVLCEVTSQARFSSSNLGAALCDGFDLLARACVELGVESSQGFVPDFVLQFGQPPTSSAWARLEETHPMQRFLVSDAQWPDPANRASAVIGADPAALLARLSGVVGPASTEWRTRMVGANHLVWRVVSSHLQRSSSFDEAAAVSAVSQGLGEGDVLLLGNSLPIRIAETVMRARPEHVRVMSQRGANGIDGLISLAAGMASNVEGPAHLTAIVGDVSFLHDVGGLLALTSQSRAPLHLTVVAVNNGGGRIFEQLPLAELVNLDAWTTPHQLDLSQIGAAFAVPSFRAESAEALRQALRIARRGRSSLVEAVVAPHGARALYPSLVSELVAGLRQPLPSGS